jgi:hypothetical protein
MAFVVVYDANVLYGNTLRDLLIRLAMAGRMQAKWTNGILDEMQRNLVANRPDISEEKFGRLRLLTNSAVRDCLVEGYEPLIEELKLPDPDDRHVLVAAIKAGAHAGNCRRWARRIGDGRPRRVGRCPSSRLAASPARFVRELNHYHQQYLFKVPNGYCGIGGTGVTCPVGLTSGKA